MSTVAKKVIMGSGAVGAYEIDQSILLNSADIPILYRQAAATGNRRTFTYSCWVKRAKEDIKMIVAFGNAGDTNNINLAFYNGSLRVVILNSGVQAQLFTNAVFRDFSSWYHIVLAVDTTQGTAANRLKLYVNGTQITSFSTEVYPSQNYDTAFSLDDNYLAVGNNPYYISDNSYNGGIDGYIAEVHILDGVAKAPSDFGETNSDTGQWVPKEYEGGSYGTNGFYGKFVSGAIGTDSSGTGNTMTVANLANADVVTDTPTNNFCTLNSVNGGATYAEGNLKGTTGASSGRRFLGTMGVSSGKWYWESKPTGSFTAALGLGVTLTSDQSNANSAIGTAAAPAWGWYSQNTNNGYSIVSSTWTSISPYFNADDVIGVALDLDNSTITFYKNGSAANVAITIPSSGHFIPIFGDGSGSTSITFEANFGQKTFAHTPPSGHVALSTANLPDPAIPLPEEQFNTVLYAGTGSAQTISGVGFQPDFSWTKCRGAETWHRLVDAVRGSNKEYFSNEDNAVAP